MKSHHLYIAMIALLIGLLYQNCSPSSSDSAESSPVESAPNPAPITSCDPQLQPPPAESVDCPVGTFGNGALRSRTVVCDSQSWVSSSWSNLNYEGCECSISGQVMDTISGICSCPAGQELVNHLCVPSNCDESLKPADVEIGSCPSNLGTSKRNRDVTCDMNTRAWQASSWSAWEYSQCACSLQGQFLDVQTGACNCPAGQTETASGCVALTCDESSKSSTSEDQLSCPNNASGFYIRTRNATCDQSQLEWVYSDWISNYNTCTCNVTGQSFNPATLSCECPSGQVVNGQRCSPETSLSCPLPEPGSIEYKSCPSNIGLASQARVVTCQQNSTEWKIIEGAWDYSNCGCDLQGALVDSKDGSCACPANSIVDEDLNACVPKSSASPGCQNPDTGALVKVGKTYSYFTLDRASSRTLCDQSKKTVTCLSPATWSAEIPDARFKNCKPNLK
ncbi:MAG: hypothetical protein ACAH59_10940 [Pseudobdellovibrionaceae bacterium]